MTEKPVLESGEALRAVQEYGSRQSAIWYVTYGKGLIKPLDPNAPPPSLGQRIRWRLGNWRYRIENAPDDVRWWLADKLHRIADRIG